jgi:hypothetical protein
MFRERGQLQVVIRIWRPSPGLIAIVDGVLKLKAATDKLDFTGRKFLVPDSSADTPLNSV